MALKYLCVAEKPSIAKSITQILSSGHSTSRATSNKYIRNYDFSYKLLQHTGHTDFTVTSVAGHITSNDFAPDFRRWKSCDPIQLFQERIDTTISSNAKSIEKNLLKEAKNASHLMIWTDCDREGEHIGYEIMNVCKRANPRIEILRARFSAIIPSQIHAAAQHPGTLDLRQARAVEARMELDLRIGAAFTRWMSLNLKNHVTELDGKIISYGPCQFPTLGFVVEQFQRIRDFISETFWYIYLSINHPGENYDDEKVVKFHWHRDRLFDSDVAFVLYEQCVENPETEVKKVDTKPHQMWKPLPLTTVELQKSGSRLLKLSPKAVLDIAESLYQKGFLSYPRTETDQYDRAFDFKTLINKQTNDSNWGSYAHNLLNNDSFETPRNGKKNDKAHPPIHPTAHAPNLTGDAKRVYEYITRRFLASCSKNAKGKKTTVEVDICGEKFSASGMVLLEKNYLEVFIYDKWSNSYIPNFEVGQKFLPSICELREGKTTAPNLLTEADLVSLMDKNGIGTDATIAEHIHKIIEREYVMEYKSGSTKYLVPSTLGIGLVEGYNKMNFEKSLSKPLLRRETEERMNLIGEGQIEKRDVLIQSIDQYKDVYIRSMRQINVLIESVRHYLHNLSDNDNNNTIEAGLPQDENNNDSDSDGGNYGGGGDNSKGDSPKRRGRPKGSKNKKSIPNSIPNVHSDSNGSKNKSTSNSNPPNLYSNPNVRITVFEPVNNNNDNGYSTPQCQCHLPAVERIVQKEGPNKGRLFYTCSKGKDNGCQFFEWKEKSNNQSTSNSIPSTSTPILPSLSPLRRSSDTRKKSFINDKSKQTIRCKCNLETLRLTTTKEGPNKNRVFYKCPNVSKSANCGFFKWEDEIKSNELSQSINVSDDDTDYVNDNSNDDVIDNVNDDDVARCFLCNETGHWSSECPNPSKKKSLTLSGSSMKRTGVCYNCNQEGHWSSECPNGKKGKSYRKSSYSRKRPTKRFKKK